MKKLALLQCILICSFGWICLGCAPVVDSPEVDSTAEGLPAEGLPAESWQCRNNLEVRCGEGECAVVAGDDFTPMSVHVESTGTMAVCAYSGCWEGLGKVIHSEEFLVLIGVDLKFSTAQEADRGQDLVVVIDRADQVATLKAGEFAHPLLCENTSMG